MKKIYLAGPDVFTRNPLRIAVQKKEICQKYRFIGVFPLDNALELDGLPPHEVGLKISAANEALMRGADAIIANITPFRGPNTDSGTAFEMGFMRSLGKPLFAYANFYSDDNDAAGDTHFERVVAYYEGAVSARKNGSMEDDRNRMLIENFQMVDNLMLDSAVHQTGGHIQIQRVKKDARYTDITAFERCVRQAKAHFK